jgi:hypothetical protein
VRTMHAKVEQRALMRIYIDDDFLYSYIVTQRVARERFTKQQTTTRFQIFDSRVRGERRVKRERREICVFQFLYEREEGRKTKITSSSSSVRSSRVVVYIYIYIYIYIKY